MASKPGTPATEEEKLALRGRMRALVSEHGGAASHAAPPRLPNKIFVQGLDHALQLGCNVKLASFIPVHILRPLAADEVRYETAATHLPAEYTTRGELHRSCVSNRSTGKTRLELMRPAMPNNVLHIRSDRGTVGWTAWFWMFSAASVEGMFFGTSPTRFGTMCKAP